jgi:hypothetical protein
VRGAAGRICEFGRLRLKVSRRPCAAGARHERTEQELLAARDTRVAQQSAEEDEAVGDERRQRAGVGAAAREEQSEDERGVDRDGHAHDRQEIA